MALQDALARTHQVLWIRNTKQTRWARNGQLIGFARATSDGVCAATIWDVAVRPAYIFRGAGVEAQAPGICMAVLGLRSLE